MAAAPAPRAHLLMDERPAQHGVVRYRSLPLGERVTLALVLAVVVVAGVIMFAMSM